MRNKAKIQDILSIAIIKQIFLFVISMAAVSISATTQEDFKTDEDIIVGAAQPEIYLPLLEGKSIAVVANQTSVIGTTHLVDSLLSLGVNIKVVFAPEHGFRGIADAGEEVKDNKDAKTGLSIISLYGKHKKPRRADLHGVDVVVFDIQDVGVRFYTYISTLHYVMEACAENVKDLVVLDRPNPNGFYVDGPILQKKQKSFVGMDPIPVVHGMTIGEYAKMVNEENWLAGGIKCALEVVTCSNYSHSDFYKLPVRPSPNLPNMAAIYMYPSLCFLEGTVISVGRGTEFPFQVFGHPELQKAPFKFVPESSFGAKNPKLKDEVCFGFDLRDFGNNYMRSMKHLYLNWLITAYKDYPDKENFFLKNNFFNLLAGNKTLMQQIIDGKHANEIQESWEDELERFKKLRKKYLLYKDFE